METRHNKDEITRHAEQGSVIYFIFIAVALFAALNFAVSNINRGSSGDITAEVAGLANSAQAKSKLTGQDDDRAIPRQMLQQVSKDLEDNLQDLAKWSARVDGLEKTFARSGALPFDPASGSKTEQKIDTRTSGELHQSDLTSFVEEDDIGW